MIPSPDPSMGPGGMMNVPGLNEPQWGSNVGVVNEDPEMTKNRQFGYAVMACAVVALAVLMVSLSVSRTGSRPGDPEAGPQRFGGPGRSGVTL